MKVLILGAGALGSFIGSRLYKVCDVCLFSRNEAHVNKIRKQGLVVEEMDGSKNVVPVEAVHTVDKIDISPDLVLVVVKSYDTEDAVRSIKDIVGDGTGFLTLQNGIGNVEIIEKFVDRTKILAGTTSLGSTLVSPGYIRHGGSGPTYIGKFLGGKDDFLEEVVDLFNKAGIKTEAVDNPSLFIWKKLLVNTGINAITAIAQVKNGWIFNDQYAKEVATEAVLEGIEVANSMGFNFGKEMVELMIQVAEATSNNISSMYQDVLKKKRTEIEFINGAIVRYGKQCNIATPVNKTLTNLVKLIENKNKIV